MILNDFVEKNTCNVYPVNLSSESSKAVSLLLFLDPNSKEIDGVLFVRPFIRHAQRLEIEF